MRSSGSRDGKKGLSQFLLAILILIAASTLQLTAMVVAPDPHGPFGVVTMVERESAPPFSYRALMPIVVDGLERSASPVAAKVRSIWSADWTQEQSITNNRAKSLLEHVGATSESDAVHLVFWGLCGVGCFATFGVSLWRILAESVGESRGGLLAVMSMLLLMPILLRPPLQMYDPMTLAMGAALAFCALRRAWIPFFLLLPLACTAKEALLILAILPMLAQIQSKSWLRLGGTVGLTVAAYLIGKAIAGTPPSTGPQFQLTLSENIDLLRGKNLGAVLLSFVVLTPILSLIVTSWKSMPRASRSQLGVTAMIMVPPLIVFGRLVEARIFYEIIPLALMLTIPHSWLVNPEAEGRSDPDRATSSPL
jgi:hypothetical protein